MFRTLIAILAVSVVYTCEAAGEPQVLDCIVAKVDTRAITLREVQEAVQPRLVRLFPRLRERVVALPREEQRSVVRGDLIELYAAARAELIDNALILREYERRVAAQTMQIPESAFDERAEARLGDPVGNGERTLREALQEEGRSEQRWRDGFREQMIISSMLGLEVDSKAVVTPRRVREAYDDMAPSLAIPAALKFQMIMISATGVEGEALDEATAVADRLANGEPFGDIARDVSVGPFAAKGGTWDWTKPADLRAELAALLAELKSGEISDWTRVGEHFYAVRLQERREAAVRPLDEVYDALERRLRVASRREWQQQWLRQLRGSAVIHEAS